MLYSKGLIQTEYSPGNRSPKGMSCLVQPQVLEQSEHTVAFKHFYHLCCNQVKTCPQFWQCFSPQSFWLVLIISPAVSKNSSIKVLVLPTLAVSQQRAEALLWQWSSLGGNRNIQRFSSRGRAIIMTPYLNTGCRVTHAGFPTNALNIFKNRKIFFKVAKDAGKFPATPTPL